MDTPKQQGKYLLMFLFILAVLAGGYYYFQFFQIQNSQVPQENSSVWVLSGVQTPNLSGTQAQILIGSELQSLTGSQSATGEEIASKKSRFLSVATTESGMQVVVEDGKPLSKPYTQIIGLKANFDGSQIWFLGRNNSKRLLVNNGVEYDTYEYVKDFWYFPQSQSGMIYVAKKWRQEMAVLDGIEQPPYERIKALTFSSDGKHYAYETQKSYESTIVYDGKEIQGYEITSSPTFSLQGQSFAFIARNERFSMDGKRYVVHDGEKSPWYEEEINSLSMSPDGKHLAYVVERDGKVLIVKDGEEELPYEYIRSHAFSPDGKSFAYISETDEKRKIVKDGKESESYEMIFFFAFASDSKSFSYAAKKDGKWNLYQDGVAGKSYDEIGQILYAPNGKEVSFQVKNEWKRGVVRNGRESQWYDYAGYLEYSPDSEKLTFIAQTGNTWNLIVNFEPLENSTWVNAFVK